MNEMNQPVTSAAESYARLLESLGKQLYWVNNIPWYRYNGFLRPAFLPHQCPRIDLDTAQKALKKSSTTFARWEHPKAGDKSSAWWLVNRRGTYSRSDLSGNTRSKVRRGHKRLKIRQVTGPELIEKSWRTCQAAVRRYGKKGFMPPSDYPSRLAKSLESCPDKLQVYGIFKGDSLLGFSENHVQGNAVLFESIWLDPEGLRDYSSYALFDSMLDHYLNEMQLSYVSDGTRTLHHETGVHEFLIDKFGFQREPAYLHVVYRPCFSGLVHGAFPLRRLIRTAKNFLKLDALEKAEGILMQESIRRASLENGSAKETRWQEGTRIK